MTIAMNMCPRICLISPTRRHVSQQSIAYRCDGSTAATRILPSLRSFWTHKRVVSTAVSAFLHVVCIGPQLPHLDCIRSLQASRRKRSKTPLQSSGKSSTPSHLHCHWRALTQATSSAVPVMSQSEHQTPNTASLPACSATLSVIYNPKHSSALFASVNTDQSMPGRVSRPVVQERHASARITSPASLISHHWRPLTTLNTLPSAHTCCHPNTFPCCLSHDNTFPNAGEVALSGGV